MVSQTCKAGFWVTLMLKEKRVLYLLKIIMALKHTQTHTHASLLEGQGHILQR